MIINTSTYKLFGSTNSLTTIDDVISETSRLYEQETDNSSAYCGECFSPIEEELDDDARIFFSRDLFCRCGR
jgi:hypothetical protein